MADSGTKPFGSILSDGLYRIPNYQRGYAWTSEEVNDLLDDLEYVTETEEVEDHYLNSIIVAEKNEGLTGSSDVIDGQQRLLTANLLANEILRMAFSFSTEDQDSEHIRNNIDERLYSDVFKQTRNNTQYRVLPADEHKEIFKNLVPTDFNMERDLDQIEEKAESPSEQKLVEAAKTIKNRLQSIINKREDSTKDKLMMLDRLATTLHGDFTATLHKVESASEAGRIFEAINDRGRNINRADKIKSYLVYRATLDDVSIPVEDIHETFTWVYKKLNTYASDPGRVDNLIDRLIGHHWTIFSNENKIQNSDYLVGRHEQANEDIDQIKHSKYHSPKNSDSERVEDWINAYLNSLENAAEAYVYIRGSDQSEIFESIEEDLSSDVDATKVRNNLHAIEQFGHSTAHSFSMALYMRFASHDSYDAVTQAMETLVVRMYGVGGARRDTKRTYFERLAHTLFWCSRNDIVDVFSNDSPIPDSVQENRSEYELDGSDKDVEVIIEQLIDWAYEYSHNDENEDIFKLRLRNKNLDGFGVARWGGLSSSELKNYLLYQYESEIREGGACRVSSI
ncbi:MAG: DUF262 domain-containing protein [Candidatus Paceibacteria bacterium]